MWTSVADLFTPTSLFLFLNLTIAAIAITSRKNKHPAAAPLSESDHRHNEHHLPRAPSLLERVRSLNFNFSDSETESTNNTPTHHDGGGRHHFFSHGHDGGGGSSLPTTPTGARALDRASSLFKSLHFSPLRRPDPEPVTPEATRAEDDHHDHRHNFFANNDGSISSPPTTPTARALERASSLFKSHGFSLLRRSSGPDPETVPEPRAEEVHHVDHRHFFADDGPSPPTTPTARALERASSLFKSHGFSLLSRSTGPDPETVPEPRAEEDHHVDHRHFFADDGPSPPTTPTARMLERASSLFKSRRFSPLLRSGGPDPEPVGDHHRDGDHDNLVKRSKSESEVRETAGAAGRSTTTRRAAGGVARMMKSASEKCAAEVEVAAAAVVEKEEEERRRPATVRLKKAVSIGDDGGVDSKADDFINRFKQQLKLQRIDSLLRNRELLRAQQQQQLHS